MTELSGNSMMVLVQVLDEKLQSLRAKVDLLDPEDPELTDLEEELMSDSIVAMELRASYEAAAARASNLPPYGELVAKR
jgi:hypothetical protein